MSYTNYARYRMHAARRMPFERHFAPGGAAGEAIHATAAAVADWVAWVFRAASAKFVENRTTAALSRLDDYTLRDIGVHRSEIRYLARRLSENPGLDYRKY